MPLNDALFLTTMVALGSFFGGCLASMVALLFYRKPYNIIQYYNPNENDLKGEKKDGL